MTDSETETSQTALNGSVKVGGNEIVAVEDDSIEGVIGWIVPFTIGNDFVVPRDWLEDRAAELGLDEWMLPTMVSPGRAFTRAGKRVNTRRLSDIELENELVEVNLNKVRYKRKYEVEIHDRREEGEFDGELIGVFEFVKGIEQMQAKPNIDEDHEMWEAWEAYKSAFNREFKLMRGSHIGEDIRHMIVRFFRTRSLSVKFRAGGGVYFAPAATGAVVQALDQLVSDIDSEWKTMGFPCELDTIEVVDADDKKMMVEEKVRRQLAEDVNEAVQEALETLASDEELLDGLVAELEESMGEVEDFAEKYNALLDAEMSVREYLEGWKDEQTGDAERLVEEVLASV